MPAALSFKSFDDRLHRYLKARAAAGSAQQDQNEHIGEEEFRREIDVSVSTATRSKIDCGIAPPTPMKSDNGTAAIAVTPARKIVLLKRGASLSATEPKRRRTAAN